MGFVFRTSLKKLDLSRRCVVGDWVFNYQ